MGQDVVHDVWRLSENHPFEGEMHGAVESDWHSLTTTGYPDYHAHWATEPNVMVTTWNGILAWQRTGFAFPKFNWKGFPLSPAFWSLLLEYTKDGGQAEYYPGGTGPPAYYDVPPNSWTLSMMWNGWAFYALFIKTGSKNPLGTYPKVVDSGIYQFGEDVTEMTVAYEG
jgi:hypothetical protein